jgi:hypothetical protein
MKPNCGLVRLRTPIQLCGIFGIYCASSITLSRFVANVPQVHSQSDWTQRLAIPDGDMGTAMAIADVDVLSQQINLAELQHYATAVAAQGSRFAQRL